MDSVHAVRAMVPLAAVALLLSGCGLAAATDPGGPSAGVDTAKKTVEIGAFVPETGPVPSYKLIAEGARAYIDWVNANGGVNGYKINYTQLDDGYDPARSLADAKQLVEQSHVLALVAPIGTPTNAAVQPYAVAQKLPVVGAVGGSPDMAQQDNYFVLLPNYHDEAHLDVSYGVDELGKKRIAVLYENDDLGKPALEGAKAAAQEKGVKVVATAAFNVSDTDLTAQITQAKNAGADLTVVWGSNSNVATAVTTAKRLGFDTQFFAPFYTADPSTYKLAGSALDDTLFGSWLLPTSDDSPSVRAYNEQMKADGHGDDIGVFSLNGWTNAALFAAGLDKATKNGEEPTRESLIAALSTFDGVAVGATPSVTFTPGDHVGTRSLSIIKATGGDFTTVTSKPIPLGSK